MTKKIYFVLILAMAGMANVNAQMRIGGSEAPNQSAVLDLNPDD
jgi:ABC-type Fe3+-hydroxamate transport system substrate-binding protein